MKRYYHIFDCKCKRCVKTRVNAEKRLPLVDAKIKAYNNLFDKIMATAGKKWFFEFHRFSEPLMSEYKKVTNYTR